MAFAWNLPPDCVLRIRELLEAASERIGKVDWYAIAEVVRQLDPEDTKAVVGYGSWYEPELRKPRSFPDLYVIVDDYERYHESGLHAWMNRVLPPNVYFLWDERDGRREVRGKYNVISAADLERECGPAPRDVYNAGRMTKVVWIAWARDAPSRAWLIARLADAHQMLAPVALAFLPERFGCDDFSLELLGLSYRAEPRLEGWDYVRALHAAHADYYRGLHGELLDLFARSTSLLAADAVGFRKLAHPRWAEIARRARRLIRRSRRRGYLRWPRILLTEPNLVDLAANEAERKAGVRIRITPRLRRHPLLYGLPEFLRVLRERKTRQRIGGVPPEAKTPHRSPQNRAGCASCPPPGDRR
jgi:hypothetical protein